MSHSLYCPLEGEDTFSKDKITGTSSRKPRLLISKKMHLYHPDSASCDDKRFEVSDDMSSALCNNALPAVSEYRLKCLMLYLRKLLVMYLLYCLKERDQQRVMT